MGSRRGPREVERNHIQCFVKLEDFEIWSPRARAGDG